MDINLTSLEEIITCHIIDALGPKFIPYDVAIQSDGQGNKDIIITGYQHGHQMED